MLKIIKQLRLIVFLLTLSLSTNLYTEDSVLLETVEKNARAWLNLTDRGKYAQNWKNASALFKANNSESDWIKNMEINRLPLGQINSRHIATAHIAESLPGFPDGEYMIIQFYTSFENKALALETVTTVKEQDKTWRVSEYLIK